MKLDKEKISTKELRYEVAVTAIDFLVPAAVEGILSFEIEWSFTPMKLFYNVRVCVCCLDTRYL